MNLKASQTVKKTVSNFTFNQIKMEFIVGVIELPSCPQI